jgi:molecular chaperone HtpG
MTADTTDTAKPETHGFQAEVSKLLDIVANALYSEKEIFLRELISNASDACDKLRYEAITKPDLLSGDPDFKIAIAIDPKAKTLTIRDNGVGMSKTELLENLGTIARSGTAAFVAGLSEDAAKDATQIGQFGVGFYSSFMVAEKVEVLTRRAGESEGWRWSSDGRGEFSIEPSDDAPERGAAVILHLKKDAKEFLEAPRVTTVVGKYADHIAVPVMLRDGEEERTLNAASALWTRPKKDITPEQYTEFYRHAGHAFDEPWLTLHWKAEGKIEYSALLFVPTQRPFDLLQPERKHQLKLYVSRVFITDDCEGLLPAWLRFLKGVVDSEDLPLNISREMLQHNPVLAKIRQGLVKRVLSELTKKAEKEPEAFAGFWENFGAVLKEGLYEDADQREPLLKLARFRSTWGKGAGDELVSLADYVARMKDGQEAIYTLTGDDIEALRASPHLEGFRARGLEVLLLTDPVDEFWVPAIASFEDKPFKSITRGAADLDKFEPETKDGKAKTPKKASAKQTDTLIAFLKLALKDAVKDVRTTERLTDSPVCLVADESDMDMHLERLLKAHRQLDHESKRILEINPGHGVIKALAKTAEAKGGQAILEDAAHVLLDQARIMEGEPVPDPAAFGRRLSGLMEKGLAG